MCLDGSPVRAHEPAHHGLRPEPLSETDRPQRILDARDDRASLLARARGRNAVPLRVLYGRKRREDLPQDPPATERCRGLARSRESLRRGVELAAQSRRLALEVLEVSHVRTHERSLLVAARACLRYGPLVVTPRELQLHRREANVGVLEREELSPRGKAVLRPLQ